MFQAVVYFSAIHPSAVIKPPITGEYLLFVTVWTAGRIHSKDDRGWPEQDISGLRGKASDAIVVVTTTSRMHSEQPSQDFLTSFRDNALKRDNPDKKQ